MARLILDVSTVARWSGPPVGIVRVEHELAMHALRRRPDIEFSFYDSASGTLRALAPAWRDRVLALDGAIETVWLDTRRHRAAWRNWLSPRFPLVMALEPWRLDKASPLAGVAGRVQRLVLGGAARRHPFGDASGQRVALVALERALGPAIVPGPGDTVLSAGSDWAHKGLALVELQRRHGFRLALHCYDLLPILHPEWFFARDVALFGAYWRAALPAAARILCNAQCVAADLRAFAAAEGLGACAPRVVPLGYTPPAPASVSAPLDSRLAPGRFALFVSTVEPRKGHATLLAAWRALLARGVPQAAGFHLVFVGRRGWKVEALLAEIDALAADASARLLLLDSIGDAALARLYRDAAFCLYPSRSEGFGLPVIEAMAYGKPVIASTGGAVAETAGGLAPCLDPLDIDAWTETLGAWIAQPAARAEWAARIAEGFRYLGWPEAAEGIFAAAVS